MNKQPAKEISLEIPFMARNRRDRAAIEPGRAVLSKQGRDAGRCFVVLKADGQYALVADGALRKVEKPKKKKFMHLRATPEFFPSIAAILQDGKMPSNADILKCVANRPPREE